MTKKILICHIIAIIAFIFQFVKMFLQFSSLNQIVETENIMVSTKAI